MNFRGTFVSMAKREVPDGRNWCVDSISDISVKTIIYQTRQFLDIRPIATLRVIRSHFGSDKNDLLEQALPYCGYMFVRGPWKCALIRFGLDPRTSSTYRLYQTLTFDVIFDPIVESGNHEWIEKDALSFFQFLEGSNNISHHFNGRKLVPNDNIWQIWDITDALLQGIVATDQIRSDVSSKDGFFYNGTMAKLEVLMRDKIICIRDGKVPIDDEYSCLLAFPDKYERPSGIDVIRYGLKFGQVYTKKQDFLRGEILKRAKSSFFEDKSPQTQRNRSHTSALQNQLTEDQMEVIDKIGNKELASRLLKKTLVIHSREERLEAIHFCQSRKHLSLMTGQERSISTRSASEVLHIREETLRRWIADQEKINAMSKGSFRADGSRKESSPKKEQYESGYYPFLMMEPEDLFKNGFVLREELRKLHPFDHPVPFIGIEAGKCGKLRTLKDAYHFLGPQYPEFHPGHPRGISKKDTPQGSVRLQDIYSASSYLNSSSFQNPAKPPTVQEINSWLYDLSPEHGFATQDSMENNTFYDEFSICVGLICQQMVAANKKLKSALPIRVELGYNQPFQNAPQHWAVSLLFIDQTQILLPLSLSLIGSADQQVVPDNLYRQGWTLDHSMLNCTGKANPEPERRSAIRNMTQFYLQSQPIFNTFKRSPVLHVRDVDMLFLRSPGWQPRRFSPTWCLYSTILNTKFQFRSPLCLTYGLYTHVELVIDKILEKGARVSFLRTPTQPFQLVKLNQFTLEKRNDNSNILYESLHQPFIRGSNSLETLQLEDLESYFYADSAIPDGDRRYRKKLHHALKSGVERGFKFVNNKEKCIFYTCSELPESPNTYYCCYHSRALIQHVLNAQHLPPRMTTKQRMRPVPLITDTTQPALQQLKSMFSVPEETWVIDFEFISMPAKYSPIPLQIAARRIDGKLLYSDNVDYHLSMKEMVDSASSYVSDKHGMMGTLFLRCYGALQTNGKTPSQIKDHLERVCSYDKSKINLISWYSAHDMQCFLRILLGYDGLIHEKISHLTAPNFQAVNIGKLCRDIFPELISGRLEVVHRYLRNDTEPSGNYHNAAFDTKAMTDIIHDLVDLL